MGLIRESGSYSTVLKKIDGIIQLMCNELDNDQEIKRLLVYDTYNPLATRSNTYDNVTIYQHDINNSLMDKTSIDVSKNQDGSNILKLSQCIFDLGWNSSKDIELKNAIYVSHIKTYTELVGKSMFIITIIVPSDYNKLFMQTNTTRSHAIAMRVIDLFDNVVTDEKSSKEDGLGDLRFKLTDKINEGKITKGVDATIIEIPIGVDLINCRADINGGILR